jgi:hypothetical protein
VPSAEAKDAKDAQARAYVDAIPAEHRPLFDRIERIILGTYPDAALTWSYQMPTYVVGKRRLHVATWAHGVSLYGWHHERDGGFTARHPELRSGRGTIRLRPSDAEAVTDDELLALVRSALDA